MSKVQRPMSEISAFRAKTTVGPAEQRGTADVGRSTLDIGLLVTDLRKSFISATGERVDVLRGVSLSASAGEAVAIMGASGAGKSTLLHLLGGLEAADHGTIEAGKFSIDGAGAATLARFRNQQIGFVFQFHHLLSDLTAAENVSMPLRIAGRPQREAMSGARLALKHIGLDKRVSESLVGHLSGGEQQRVAVCRALITHPTLVLADEPTGNLDADTGDEIARALVNYSRNMGGLVIIATHNKAVAEMCDRTLVLSDGRLVPA